METEPVKKWDHPYALLQDLVERCDVCLATREALELLQRVEYDPDLGSEVEIPGIEDMRVQCCCCDGKGYRLTDKGKALLQFFTDLAPFQLKEKQIPF